MAGIKHSLPDEETATPHPQNGCIAIFETFRAELDEHHERRERVIKASRDITALSKKVIFSLQRVRQLRKPIPTHILKTINPFQTQIHSLFCTVAADLQQINTYRYQRQISPGLQEYIESLAFQHYLEHQSLVPLEKAQNTIPGILLTEGDFLLGIFDMVGEMMRFAITGIATNGSLPSGTDPESGKTGDILADMQALRMGFEALDLQGSNMRREVDKKTEIMQECVAKVEKAAYGVKIRGNERPKGWMPDLGGDDKREAIEGY